MNSRGGLTLLRVERGEGRLSFRARTLPPLFLLAVAKRRRKRGVYDLRTLALYRSVWRRRKTSAALLDYALFRRDMGYHLPIRWGDLLLKNLNELPPARRPLALSLAGESVPSCLLDVSAKDLQAGRRMAPLAAACCRRGMEGPGWLASLHDFQEVWREGFAALVRQQRPEGICVVGNGGNIPGGGHGPWIDGHALVVRFNRFRNEKSEVHDTGSKMDIWVGAPGFPSSAPAGVDWAVITGPDMRFRRQDWGPLRERLEDDKPVLTVPLEIWRNLVALLHAPPSAGVLLLAWLKALLGGWEGLSTVGLGVTPSGKIPYHHADPRQKAVERHNWPAERALLRKWYAEGLYHRG